MSPDQHCHAAAWCDCVAAEGRAILIDAHELRALVYATVKVTAATDALRVSTQCLYPSNDSVRVTVRGGENRFVVSDEGGASKQIGMTGATTSLTDRQVRSLVKSQGLKVQDGAIFSPEVPLSALPGAIVLVANASKEVADWGLQHLKFSIKRDFRIDLTVLLERYFHDNLKHDAPIIGKSNKPHKFDHVIYLPRERILLVDAVSNEPSSISSSVAANVDIKLAQNPAIEQLIIFDDEQEWDAANLNFLGLGARTVGFSSAESAIQRMAA